MVAHCQILASRPCLCSPLPQHCAVFTVKLYNNFCVESRQTTSCCLRLPLRKGFYLDSLVHFGILSNSTYRMTGCHHTCLGGANTFSTSALVSAWWCCCNESPQTRHKLLCIAYTLALGQGANLRKTALCFQDGFLVLCPLRSCVHGNRGGGAHSPPQALYKVVNLIFQARAVN